MVVKVNRQMLIPMLNTYSKNKEEGNREIDEKLTLLFSYKDKVSDQVIFYSKGMSVVPLLEKAISEGFKPIVYLPYPSDNIMWKRWIKDNRERLSGVLTGHPYVELEDPSLSYYEWDYRRRTPNLRVARELVNKYNDYGQLIIAPFETAVERDAWRCYGDYDKTVLAKFLRENTKFAITFCGFWCLYRNFAEQREAGYTRNKQTTSGNGPWIDPRDLRKGEYYDGQGEYPFEYYQAYLRNSGVNWYSGIGLLQGAQNGNLQKLVNMGYKGAVFYVPTTEREMDVFTKDVNNSQTWW